jgi:hyperosmotically inducible periplasmic protein
MLFALVVLCLTGGCRARAAVDLGVPDAEVTASVKNTLAADPASDFRGVNVETRNGTVTLTGTVGLWAESTRAEARALRTRGVKEVQNRLQVEPSRPAPDVPGLLVPDPEITLSVERELAADPVSGFPRVTVDTTDGVVTLTGTVGLWAESARAEERTSKIPGVKGVVNRLQLEPPKTVEPPKTTTPAVADLLVPDAEITASVKSTLAADPVFDFARVTVHTTDGMVTLSGSVDLWAERSLAEERTSKMRGVKGVINRLQVDPPKPPR